MPGRYGLSLLFLKNMTNIKISVAILIKTEPVLKKLFLGIAHLESRRACVWLQPIKSDRHSAFSSSGGHCLDSAWGEKEARHEVQAFGKGIGDKALVARGLRCWATEAKLNPAAWAEPTLQGWKSCDPLGGHIPGAHLRPPDNPLKEERAGT